MTINWTDFVDDVLGKDFWNGVSSGTRKQAYDLIESWLGADGKVLANAIADALGDKKSITKEDVIGILLLVAQYAVKDSKAFAGDFITKLMANLSDGELTPTEVAEAAINWVATQKQLPANLLDLLRAAVGDRLNRDAVKNAILDWIEQKGGKPLRQSIEALLKGSQPVNLRGLVLLTVTYLVQEGKLTQAGVTDEDFIANVNAALQKLQSTNLAEVFDFLAKGKYPEAAADVLTELGVDKNKELAKTLAAMLLGQKPEQAISDFLSKAIARKLGSAKVTDAQATKLAETIIGVVKGDIHLIPDETEREYCYKKFGFAEKEFRAWQQVREILYAATLAVAGGPVVPSDAMARPHVFAAAKIDPDTPLTDLTGGDADMFLQYVKLFTRNVYANNPRGAKYRRDDGAPISEDNLKAKDKAMVMFDDIWFNIYE